MQSHKRILFFVQFSLLLAIEAVFSFTPLGSIPFTPVVVATLFHIPVIITAILLGTAAGTAMGFMGGVFSFITWTFMPPNPLTAFMFSPLYGNGWSLLICFVPRILIGLSAGLIYDALKKRNANAALRYTIPAILGTFANTVFVLGGTWLFFGARVAETNAAIWAIVCGVILTNGIPEAAVAAAIVPAVCLPLIKRIRPQ